MIHSIKIDADIEERLSEFNRCLPSDQKVLSMVCASDYLFLTVEKRELPLRAAHFGDNGMILQDHLKRGPHRT